MNSASYDQRKIVGISCDEYSAGSFMSLVNGQTGRSCDTCEHWNGQECMIEVFDKVLVGLDQT